VSGIDSDDGASHRHYDLDGRNLEEVRRRVVDPVLRALLREDEIDAVELRTGRSVYRAEQATWVVWTACGEAFECYVCRADGLSTDPDMAAADLYDRVWEEILESRFAWGRDRAALHGKFAQHTYCIAGDVRRTRAMPAEEPCNAADQLSRATLCWAAWARGRTTSRSTLTWCGRVTVHAMQSATSSATSGSRTPA
jgi:hypothetical protein